MKPMFTSISQEVSKLPMTTNSLRTLSLENSSILVYIDTTTFGNPKKQHRTTFKFESEKEPSQIVGFKQHLCCVMGCKDFRKLHRAPQDEISREVWRKYLRLKIFNKGHRVCDKHFRKKIGFKKRLPGWAVPDTPETSDTEEDFTVAEPQSNENDNNTEMEFSIEDMFSCK